jgi:Alpha/beta hydrolase domain
MVTTPGASIRQIPGKAPDLMSDFDLAELGYEETEFFVDGRAASFKIRGERGEDGKWDVTPAAEADFRTRMLVRRPSDPQRFSGTVVVEWNNVSAGIDASPDWILLHRHLAAQGHAWVGMSAQKAGIDGGGLAEGMHLKLLAPERYDTLVHPGDAWSFDIFSQTGALLRRPAEQNPLRGLKPGHILAMGESQSAACLVTYINAIDPLARVFDGFFVHGRPGVGVTIDGALAPAARSLDIRQAAAAIFDRGERVRDDARVPVLVLQSETDVVILGGGRAERGTPSTSACGSSRARRTPIPTSRLRAGMTTARWARPGWPSSCAQPATCCSARPARRSTPAPSSTMSARPPCPALPGG